MEFNVGDSNKVSLEEKTNMFAKNILLSWINRITFANLLKDTHNSVYEALRTILEQLDFDIVGVAFNEATKISDFYTILHCDENELKLSSASQKIIREYASFVNGINLNKINQDDFRNTLENIVELSKREVMGLFTTPKNLAKLLVYSSVENTNADMIDPCVGSGTIASQMMNLSGELKGVDFAHEHVWASDKYKLPLQIANLSMSSLNSLDLTNKIFQRDLLSLRNGQKITLTDPKEGKSVDYSLPEFDYVISNLPFIRSERLKNDTHEKDRMVEVNTYLEDKNLATLSGKADWYQYGIVGIERILKSNGIMAVITSNSWLKTVDKFNFIEILFELFEIKKIIISSNGRWFDNADVVSLILIAQKKKSDNNKVKFIKLKDDISMLSDNEIEKLSDSILEDNTSDKLSVNTYSREEIGQFISDGLSLNILFNDISWYKEIRNVTISMKNLFTGQRGVKSGNDGFFYKNVEQNTIEEEFVYPALGSLKNVKGFYASADSHAFIVRGTINSLAQRGKNGAVAYIKKFQDNKTKTQLTFDYWYQFPKIVTGDFATAINPDRRLFWSILPKDLVINQRATVFKLKDENTSRELIHALLNTYFAQFMIEAVGFGRGLGVLDTTKDGILDSVMLNPNLLGEEAKQEILECWAILSKQEVPDILDQLKDEEWIKFNKLVFSKYDKKEILPDLMETLKNAVEMRSSARMG